MREAGRSLSEHTVLTDVQEDDDIILPTTPPSEEAEEGRLAAEQTNKQQVLNCNKNQQ